MTAYGTVETAVEAMQLGAADYLTKPFQIKELDVRLRRLVAAKAARLELRHLREILHDVPAGGLVGPSQAMREVRERIVLFADAAAPILVTGETGTGKELVARALHQSGPRHAHPFVAVACGAIPRDLAESQLFGHEKGSFTGATSKRQGCFEQASGGTLLLDDVDDLPLDLQVKLLRVLQEGCLVRVGGSEEIHVNVRVVATTKVDLTKAATGGLFREDLLYRLRGLEIHLPPLRHRGDDVLVLAQQFLRVLSADTDASPGLTAEAAAFLRRHHWPGNVRELRRAMESATVLARSGDIAVQHLPSHLGADPQVLRPYVLHLDDADVVKLSELVRQFEQDVMDWALQKAHGQQSGAARILGIPRTTLQSKLNPDPQ